MSTVATPQPGQPIVNPVTQQEELSLKVYSHSPIIYWWPVWGIGYLLAALTYFQGVTTNFNGVEVLIHPSPALGVLFTFTFLLVIVMTHGKVRGIASLTVIISMVAVVLFLAYVDWWDDIFRVMGKLAIFMNLGFYVLFSTAIFAVWGLAVFFFDRLDYWEFRPGQAIHHTVLGGGEDAYDTRGMVVEKLRDDLFRHWILGMGSGDLHIATTGAKKGDFVVKNVAFVGNKLLAIQRLAAMKPDDDPLVAQAPVASV